MLIPVNPSRALKRSGKRASDEEQSDVHVEVISASGNQEKKVGRAKATGRTEAINRKGP
jgi:hypothetical protein